MAAQDKKERILYQAVYRLLKPLVRLLLRNNIPFAAFADLAKRAYVETADEHFQMPGRKQSDSRIATITGLTRKDVARLKKLDFNQQNPDVSKYHRAARVVYGWVHDKKYADTNGQSAILPFDAQQVVSFSQLVKEYSGDVPPRAILDELLRVGVVQCDAARQDPAQQKVELLERAYIPKTGSMEKLQLLGRDVSGLISTMDRNIHGLGTKPFFQRKVFYDNLPKEAIAGIQALIAEEGQSLLEQVDKYMSEHDRDSNPKVKGTGRKACGIGLYYFEEPLAQEQADTGDTHGVVLEEAS